MNYYGRRYRLRRRYPRYTRRSLRYSSSSARRASGNAKAAIQQRDSTQVNISVPSSIEVANILDPIALYNPYATTPEKYWSSLGVGVINIWDLLRRSVFYQSYSNMYDQVKIDRIRIKLTPNSYIATLGKNFSNYTVVTAWDRTGLSEEQLSINAEHTQGNNANEVQLYAQGAKKYGSNNEYGLVATLTADDIATYSSAITKPVSQGSSASIVRTLYPRTTQEKGFYVNTADLDKWYENKYVNAPYSWSGIENARAVASGSVTVNGANLVPASTLSVVSSHAVQRNPCFVGESPNIPWKPTLLIGILNKQKITYINNPNPAEDDHIATANPTINFFVEADIGVTFRGLRKAPLVQ